MPELWKTHPNATHDRTFNSCSNAPNYPEAFAAGWSTSPTVSLTIETIRDNTIVNLSQYLNPLEDNKEIEINWGDDVTETISIDNVEHNYENAGEYIVDIEGDIEWIVPRLRMINNDWRIVEVRLKEIAK